MEFAYHFNNNNKLLRIHSHEEWEFNQVEKVRHDVAVLILHEGLYAKYKETINKERFDWISIEEVRAKIKEIRESEDQDGGDEKPITESEVYEYIRKHYLTENNNKVKLFADLVRDNLDKYHEMCNTLNIYPKKLLFLNATLKSFVNLLREENPEAKEEDIEEEERNTKNQELDKLRSLRDKLDANKSNNLYELCELNADLNHKNVLDIIDKL